MVKEIGYSSLLLCGQSPKIASFEPQIAVYCSFQMVKVMGSLLLYGQSPNTASLDPEIICCNAIDNDYMSINDDVPTIADEAKEADYVTKSRQHLNYEPTTEEADADEPHPVQEDSLEKRIRSRCYKNVPAASPDTGTILPVLLTERQLMNLYLSVLSEVCQNGCIRIFGEAVSKQCIINLLIGEIMSGAKDSIFAPIGLCFRSFTADCRAGSRDDTSINSSRYLQLTTILTWSIGEL